MKVSDSLTSCTSDIKSVLVQHPKYPTKSVLFVDTVGFDDTVRSDVDVLKMTSDWLVKE